MTSPPQPLSRIDNWCTVAGGSLMQLLIPIGAIALVMKSSKD